MLGGTKIEGIVVKNYNKYFDELKHPYLTGYWKVGKFVREEFKEANKANWKNIKGSPVQILISSLKTTARWDKAVIHLKEKGELENKPQDIGNLIKEIIRDVEEEEKENIKEALYKAYQKDILNGIIRGFPEYYKLKLLENIKQ